MRSPSTIRRRSIARPSGWCRPRVRRTTRRRCGPSWRSASRCSSGVSPGHVACNCPLCPQEWPNTRGHSQDAGGGKMTQDHQFAILYPLVVGVGAVACTIFVHALALAATVKLFRHERRLGHVGAGALIDLAIVAVAISFAFVAHLIEIALWAVLLIICGEFQGFGNAFYHSAVNYTTLGYGDLLLTPSWRLLGPLEAANGALMFGVFDRDSLCRYPTAASGQV